MTTKLEYPIQIRSLITHLNDVFEEMQDIDIDDKVEFLNHIKLELKKHSPFKNEPVDCVVWVKNDSVDANDYNPNSVAPPEMELLRKSIENDGYTQPIVTWKDNEKIEVIDGFHRNRVGKECDSIKERVHGYLPVVTINDEMTDKKNRIASTIRHNRARGKHKVESMSDIVLELKNRNWTNKRICKELGMDEDEVLRLCQITGLEDLFKDGEFSQSWEIGSSDDDYQYLTDSVDEDDSNKTKTVNTSDPDRVFHTYEKWECHKAGFYNTKKDGMKKAECEQEYHNVLSNQKLFSSALEKIIVEWKNSCEHYLTNKAMNRIAWLGQAAVCYLTEVPSKFSSGWSLLSDKDQNFANNTALKYLNIWLINNGLEEVSLADAISEGRQISIY